jgi:hypothetical protein
VIGRRGLAACLVALVGFSCSGPEAVITPPRRAVSKNPLGVVFSLNFPVAKRIAIASGLGVSYIRLGFATAQADRPCAECDLIPRHDLELILTVFNRTEVSLKPSEPPADLAAYGRAVGKILDSTHPVLLVVENEEDARTTFNGTPDQYVEQLSVACRVAHARGVRCTNGGFLSGHVAHAVYQHYVDTGQHSRATSYADRAFEPWQKPELGSAEGRAKIKALAALVKGLLKRYRPAGADYVNFHWYAEEPRALAESVRYLEEVSGLPAITNEIGQRTEDPADTRRLLDGILRVGLPVAIWYGSDARLARGLVDFDGTLRPTGEAFRAFILDHFGRST